MSAHVFLVAAEDSGDAIAADVIDALRVMDPAIRLSGFGGVRMADRGVCAASDMSALAVLGLVDGLKAFGRVKQQVETVRAQIAVADPDAVVLIDSWGFMWRLARSLKLSGLRARRIKLVGPQVWATRPGRARVLAQWCEHLLCIHAFEQPFYAKTGLATTVIGNPALDRLPTGDGAAFRARHAIAAGRKLIGLLPGSRRSEIRRVAPVLTKAAARLCAAEQDRMVVCVVAASVAEHMREAAKGWTFPYVLSVEEDEKPDAMAAMDVALACSGTVTTELAQQGAALVVGYRLGWTTWAIARAFLMRSKYIALINVAGGEEIAPEFVQTRFTSARVAAAGERLLCDPERARVQADRQRAALSSMKRDRPAPVIAAEAILHVARAPRP